jgi:hypothetical protein
LRRAVAFSDKVFIFETTNAGKFVTYKKLSIARSFRKIKKTTAKGRLFPRERKHFTCKIASEI